MRRGDPIAELRRAIDRLPAGTRRAMLDGVRANPIVVGAYTDSAGGICPMLAAHRHGGRTTFLPFARAWDHLGASHHTRRATEREVGILVGQLEASLAEPPDTDLSAAIAEHRSLLARSAAATAPVASSVPPGEIRAARLSPRRRADATGALARFERELDRI